MPLLRALLAEFDEQTAKRGLEIASTVGIQIVGDAPRHWLVRLVDNHGELAIAVAQRQGRRVVEAFCTCGRAMNLDHRCEHVLAAFVVIEEDSKHRIDREVRRMVPLWPKEQAVTAQFLLESIVCTSGPLHLPSERFDAVRLIDEISTMCTDRHQGRRTLATSLPPWRQTLESIRPTTFEVEAPKPKRKTRLHFHLLCPLDADEEEGDALLFVEVRRADESIPGRIGGHSLFSLKHGNWNRVHPDDRELATLVVGSGDEAVMPGVHVIERPHIALAVELMARSGRATFETLDPHRDRGGWRRIGSGANVVPAPPLRWHEGSPITTRLDLRTANPESSRSPGSLQLVASYQVGDRTVPADGNAAALIGEIVLAGGVAGSLATPNDATWADGLRIRPVEVPVESVHELLDLLADHRDLPRLDIEPDVLERIGWTVDAPPTRAVLTIAKAAGRAQSANAAVALEVAGNRLVAKPGTRTVIDPEARRIVRIDEHAVPRLVDDLGALGLLEPHMPADQPLKLDRSRIPQVVRELAARGWIVELDGSAVRAAHSISASVKWNMDWFEVAGEVDFGGVKTTVARLFEAIRNRSGVVTLADGTTGLVPQAWLDRLALAADAATETPEGTARFQPSQLALVEAAVRAADDGATIDFDTAASTVRERLLGFNGVRPADPPESFTGTIRDYQRIGVGWMDALRELGLGGCLADDMGLGKTIQVLAMLESRRVCGASAPTRGAITRAKPKRTRRRATVTVGDRDPAPTVPDRLTDGVADTPEAPTPVRTTLVVAPRSLIHNWRAEAERFAPSLRTIDLSDADRRLDAEVIAEHDLALTTYGLLRRDVGALSRIEFDHLILDEAQAIKNARSQTAQAAKLLRGRHRLALTGTPVENHLGELWSLVEFLNPAFLPNITRQADGPITSPETAAVAAKAVRPFILRRTKGQVAAELPDRIERTVLCTLEGTQRRLYDRLRREIRSAVLAKVDENGLGRAGIEVLQGLLRLRQVACHPGLLGEQHRGAGSAKFDSLLPTLVELAEEGHKTLVFSQFTTLLDLVEPLLTEAGLGFERLDGSTRNRQERVERFQSDPTCPVFLLSLKAGGVGLNLTAADHVILLDPWWNPAIEAQAIDRAHRIGQHRTVIATRLIAADTIEQRILDLQAMKREIFDAIVGENAGPLASLTREDLERLLN